MSFRPVFAVLLLAQVAGAALAGPSEVPAQPAQIPADAVPGTILSPAPPKEVRGVWVVRTDLTSPQAVSRVVQHARANGLNTLFAQCRGRGDAFYASTLEPRAQSLEGA